MKNAVPALLLVVLAAPPASAGSTFTVTNTNDSGAGSLRQAIHDSNTNGPGPNAIHFAITGAVVHTIKPLTQLDDLSVPVTIDGYTQTGATANTLAVGDNAVILIEIDATNLNPAIAIGSAASGSTIQGLCISHLAAAGIDTRAGANNNTIAGNFLGVDPTGLTESATNYSVHLENTSGNTLGGTTPAARNLIASQGVAVLLESATGTVIQGNYVNCNKNGDTAFPSSYGVDMGYGTGGNTVGGTVSGARNVIAGSGGAAVEADDGNDVIQGNYIGVTADGTSLLSSGGYGIVGQTHPSTFGGTAAGAGNLIGGAGVGIYITGGDGWVIEGNSIGTDATGTNPIPNGCGFASIGGSGTIGGTTAGAGNVIAFNGAQGISLLYGAKWAIRGNSIHDNTASGIAFNSRCDIADATPWPNDDCDTDGPGPNGFQNNPVITHVKISSGKATVTGTLNSTASTTFDVDVFSNTSNDLRNHGEGKTFLGTFQAQTDGSCHATFGPIELPNTVPANERVFTTTATDPDGNTSEFSLDFRTGDINGDGKIDVADVFYLINFLFAGGPPPVGTGSGDVDGNDVTDVTDIFYLINFLFAGGPSPV